MGDPVTQGGKRDSVPVHSSATFRVFSKFVPVVTHRLSLTMRAFLLAFLPVCFMLVGSFYAVNATLRSKIKEGLKQSLLQTERARDSVNTEFNRRTIQLLAILSEDAGSGNGNTSGSNRLGFKAGPKDISRIERQLREVGELLEYDLLILNDGAGRPLAGFVGKNIQDAPLDSFSSTLDLFPFINVGGILFEATTVPINLGEGVFGRLTMGKKFNIASLNSAGYSALVYNDKVLLTNLPKAMVAEVEGQLRTRCSGSADFCEVRAERVDYLTLRLERTNLRQNVQLFTFQSIDAAMDEYTRGFIQAFLLIGTAGIFLALVFSVLGSRSVSKPLIQFVAHLMESRKTGRLEPDFPADFPLDEVNLLAEAFNQAARTVQESQSNLEEATLQFVETMAQALDARDPYTAGHSNRVSANSYIIADAMGLPPDEVEIIRIGAQLHDIGKIGVPDAILQKPGALTREEFHLIRLHPQIGKRILEKVGRFHAYLPIVELHHEDYNGGGYPYGQTGKETPLAVRIVHVADVYDALTSNRAYRKAMSDDEVRHTLMENSGKMFDPAVVDVFLEILHKRKILEGILEQASVPRSPAGVNNFEEASSFVAIGRDITVTDK